MDDRAPAQRRQARLCPSRQVKLNSATPDRRKFPILVELSLMADKPGWWTRIRGNLELPTVTVKLGPVRVSASDRTGQTFPGERSVARDRSAAGGNGATSPAVRSVYQVGTNGAINRIWVLG